VAIAIVAVAILGDHTSNEPAARTSALPTPTVTLPPAVRSTDAAATSAPAPAATPKTQSAQAKRAAQRSAEARRTINRLIAAAPRDGISVAVHDLTTGEGYTAGATSGMVTASTYKLLVLETMLLQRQSVGWWSEGELAQATAAIEHSDNTAGYDLFLNVGGNSALDATLRTFGMRHTVLGVDDPTFTTSSAPDCLILAKNLVKSGPLDSASRSYALGLMRDVAVDQRWGVGAAADPGTSFANKNGWLGIDDDGGLWAVSSTGVVTVHGHKLLLAVMTQHSSDFQTGVNLVEKLAKATATVVTP
jgi:beta-lactamase class A